MIRDRDPNELELRHMRIVVNALDGGLRRFASGSLDETIDTPFPARFEGMRRDFNRGMGAVNGAMDAITENARLLRSDSDSLRRSIAEGARKDAEDTTRLSEAVAATGTVAQGLRHQKALAQHTTTIAQNARLDLRRPKEAVAAALKLIEELGREPLSQETRDRLETLSATTEQIGRELDALGLYLEALSEHVGNLEEAAKIQAETAALACEGLGELARSRRTRALQTDIATLTLDRMDRDIAEIDRKAGRFTRVTIITPPPHDPGATRGSHLRLVKS